MEQFSDLTVGGLCVALFTIHRGEDSSELPYVFTEDSIPGRLGNRGNL